MKKIMNAEKALNLNEKVDQSVFENLSEEQQKLALGMGFNKDFGHGKDLQDAYNQATQMIETMSAREQVIAIVMLHTMVNTYALEAAKRMEG